MEPAADPAPDRRLGPLACSAADWLAVVAPRLSPPWAGEEAKARLIAVARRLPGDALIALECHAGGRIDLASQVTSETQAASVAAGLASGAARDFLHTWAARPQWQRQVPALWLEFDLAMTSPPSEASLLPEPLLCARLAAEATLGWVAGSLLPAMRGRPLGEGQRQLLESCWRWVPTPGRPLYVVTLASRGTSAVRLEVGGGLGLDVLVTYLERLGAPRQAASIAALAPVLEEAERLHLSFDIEDPDGGEPGSERGIGPRVGVETSFPRQPAREPRWGRLLARARSAGLCSGEAVLAALAWPGQDSVLSAPSRWPVGDGGAGGALPGRCVRCLSHLKLVGEPHRPVTAKPYLLYAHLQGRA